MQAELRRLMDEAQYAAPAAAANPSAP